MQGLIWQEKEKEDLALGKGVKEKGMKRRPEGCHKSRIGGDRDG